MKGDSIMFTHTHTHTHTHTCLIEIELDFLSYKRTYNKHYGSVKNVIVPTPFFWGGSTAFD